MFSSVCLQSPSMSQLDLEHLRLTDFLDLGTLQEIQDGFAAVASVNATIADAEGNVLTSPTPTQEFLLRQRMNELTAVYNLSMMLADARDLPKVLQRTAQAVCEIMNVKAASIRLIDEENDELVIKAVHNLSAAYLDKGPIRLSKS